MILTNKVTDLINFSDCSLIDKTGDDHVKESCRYIYYDGIISM